MAKLKIIVMVMLTVTVTSAKAAWKVVLDPWTTAQVTANTTAQGLIENQHNARLDSMSAKQQKIMQYTTAMETIKGLYSISMQNISGFGEETKYYAEIFGLTTDILTAVPQVLDYIGRSPVKNYVLCLSEMSDVVLETEGLVADFVDIVNNGKIQNPLKNKGKTYTKCPDCGGKVKKLIEGGTGKTYSYTCLKCGWKSEKLTQEENTGDGYNFLNRYERLTLANRIYSRLLEIKYKMDVMCMMCQYCNGINDVLMAIDVQSWAAYFTGKNIVEGIVNDWNTLGV